MRDFFVEKFLARRGLGFGVWGLGFGVWGNWPELLARRPDFHVIFDFDAEMAEAARHKIYDRVATDRIRITGYHFPFPANGYMAKEGSGYPSSRPTGRARSELSGRFHRPRYWLLG